MTLEHFSEAFADISDKYLIEASDEGFVKVFEKKPKRSLKLMLIAAAISVSAVLMLIGSMAILGEQNVWIPPTDGTTDITDQDLPPIKIPEGYKPLSLTFVSNGNGTSTIIGISDENGGKISVEDSRIKDIRVYEYGPEEYDFPHNKRIEIYDGNKLTYSGLSRCEEANEIETIVIPEGTESIPYGAFQGFRKLYSVVIPDSVKNIGHYAFAGCISLKSVNIPNGVENIGRETFSACRALTDITLPDSVKIIGEEAFSGCGSLKTAVLGKNVQRIERAAFTGCASLGGVELPTTLEYIGDHAFSYCKALSSISIPDSAKYIGKWIFAGNDALVEISVPFIGPDRATPDTLGYIFNLEGEGWYPAPKLIERFSVTNAVAIADGAFCLNIRRIELNEGIISIGEDAFCGNMGYYQSTAKYHLSNGVLIPDSVEMLLSLGSLLMTELHIGPNVREIEMPNLLGYKNIVRITVDPKNQYFCEVDGILFSKDKKTLYIYPSGSERDFYEVPSSVENIGNKAFYYADRLSEIILPEGLISIGYEAFASDISRIYAIPSTVESIGYHGIYSPGSTVYCAAKEKPEGWNDGWIYSPKTVEWGTVFVSSRQTKLDLYEIVKFSPERIRVSENNPVYSDISGVLFNKEQTELLFYPADQIRDEYFIPKTVTSIASGAFFGNKYLKEIIIHDGVEKIGEHAICAEGHRMTVQVFAESKPDGFNDRWYFDNGNIRIEWGAKDNWYT